MSRAAPPLAVGMPVYNGEAYVERAITSILAQTFGDFEFIISDNASTDGTEEICLAYAAADSRIRYSRLPDNRGAAPNFNRVFLMSDSPYFKFAASDDMCEPTLLERCLEAHEEAAGRAVLCFPTAVKVDADDQRVGIFNERMALRQTRPHERFRAYLIGQWMANCFYGVLRSDAFGSTRLHRSYDAADMVLLGELALRGQFWHVDEPLFLRRVHDGMSHKINTTSAAVGDWLEPGRHHRRALPKTQMSWEFMRAIDATPMSVGERMRCRRELAAVWLRKYWKTIAKEVVESTGIPVPRPARNKA